jgi:methylsterol monooxygenase
MSSSSFQSSTELPWLDQLWLNCFQDRNPLIVLTCISFIVHEIVYFGRFLPFYIADQIPSLKQYKIQEDKSISNAQWWKCFRGVMIGHFCFELPLMLGFHPTAQMVGMKVTEVPLPSWSAILGQTVLFLIFEDMFHYWAHRALHYGNLYKWIHKQHHEYAAPVGLCAEYAHPLEILILSMGTFLGPLIYTWWTQDFHVFTMLFWSVIRTIQAVDAHSGYDFPWSLHNFIPFWSGADHHDFHHQAFVGNYATSFRWWDAMMRTEGNYHVVRSRQALAKAEKKLQNHGLARKDSKMNLKSES